MIVLGPERPVLPFKGTLNVTGNNIPKLVKLGTDELPVREVSTFIISGESEEL